MPPKPQETKNSENPNLAEHPENTATRQTQNTETTRNLCYTNSKITKTNTKKTEIYLKHHKTHKTQKHPKTSNLRKHQNLPPTYHTHGHTKTSKTTTQTQTAANPRNPTKYAKHISKPSKTKTTATPKSVKKH